MVAMRSASAAGFWTGEGGTPLSWTPSCASHEVSPMSRPSLGPACGGFRRSFRSFVKAPSWLGCSTWSGRLGATGGGSLLARGLLAAGSAESALRVRDGGVSTLMVPRRSIICSRVPAMGSWFWASNRRRTSFVTPEKSMRKTLLLLNLQPSKKVAIEKTGTGWDAKQAAVYGSHMLRVDRSNNAGSIVVACQH